VLLHVGGEQVEGGSRTGIQPDARRGQALDGDLDLLVAVHGGIDGQPAPRAVVAEAVRFQELKAPGRIVHIHDQRVEDLLAED